VPISAVHNVCSIKGRKVAAAVAAVVTSIDARRGLSGCEFSADDYGQGNGASALERVEDEPSPGPRKASSSDAFGRQPTALAGDCTKRSNGRNAFGGQGINRVGDFLGGWSAFKLLKLLQLTWHSNPDRFDADSVRLRLHETIQIFKSRHLTREVSGNNDLDSIVLFGSHYNLLG